MIFKATWTAYDVKDYTVSVYAADKFDIYDSDGKTSNLTTNLLSSLNSGLLNLNLFTYDDGGWNYVRRGFIGSGNDTYFFQYGGPTLLYNLNITVRLTSY
jgi:hypothetical protein